jgi:hypothetical protein
MIEKIYVFDDVITKEEQNEILQFVKTTDIEWTFEKNITGQYGGKYEKFYPANVLPKYKLNNHQIDELITKIQHNVVQKLNLNFVENYRYKINWTKPLEFEYDARDLMHIDRHEQHIVMIYYINDTSGDTFIYNNNDGNNVEVSLKYMDNQIDYSKLTLIKSVEPKQGRVVVFNGALHHHASYPKVGDRYIINFNFVAKEKNKSLI